MIFWLFVLKLEISYHRVYNIFKDLFWFLSEDFFEIYIFFAMVKKLSFHNSSSFALRYFLV
jgi:hypothetical protein